MNKVLEVQRINERELEAGLCGSKSSWHYDYRASAWIFFGNMESSLSEG
jgi:RNA-binding motif X-linked protein 2